MNVREWLGKSVRVYAGHDWRKEHRPMVEGEVIGVIDCPSIVVRTPNGGVSTWPISLPMDEIRLCGHTWEAEGRQVACTRPIGHGDYWHESRSRSVGGYGPEMQ